MGRFSIDADRLDQPETMVDLSKFEQLRCTGELPSPKGAALAIIRLTQRPDAPLSELVHAIKADPAFVARLIKAANGVNAIGKRPVLSIQNALTVLGLPAVRSLALGFSLLSSYRGGNCRSFDYQRFWSHSLVCAVALQALSSATQSAQPEEAFSVGLLARIGELALATLFPAKYSDLLQRMDREPDSRLLDLEQEAFVMTHNELSAAMMLDWGVPKVYTDPLEFFETLDKMYFEEGSRAFKLTHLLALADYVADVCLAQKAEQHDMMARLFLLGARVFLDADKLMAICDKVAREWLEWGGLLNVAATAVPPFEELASPPAAPELAEGMLPDAVAGRRMRVLLVDDDPVSRLILRTTLAKAGHELFEAVNGRQGFEMAVELRPDLMMVDWLMPEMDGIELTKALRRTKVGRSIYIMILTGRDTDASLIEAFESGVNDFMGKPLRPKVLIARLLAAQRVVKLQAEIERESEEIRLFAAELAVTSRRLQEVAMTDMLTGFPNRRYAIERIEQEWAAANRSKRPLAAMVIDVDEFKRVNDAHGHDVGDTVLRRVAAALKSGVRAQDVVCRFGGDEFLVICPDTTLDAAIACAERMRQAVAALTDDGMRHTVSVGVAVRGDDMAHHDALITRADQGVFVAKQRGRDRVVALQS